MKYGEITVTLVKPKSRFILCHYGQELVLKTPSHGKRLEWKTLKGAQAALYENEFFYEGQQLNKDNIDIVELKEVE